MDVATTLNTIRDNLQDGFFDGVSADELRENSQALDLLSGDDTNSVIEQLSDDELAKWADELYDGKTLGIFGSGGLNIDERNSLYNNLAVDLDSEQLERVYHALGDEDRQAEFIGAIATHSSETTRVSLIEQLASQTTDGSVRFEASFAVSGTDQWDQDAAAVSTLIGSLTHAPTIEQAFAALDNEQLQAVLEAGTRPETMTSSMGHASHTSWFFDTTGLTSVLESAAVSGDNDLKARVFELASRQIEQIRDTDSLLAPNPSADERAGEVADALSELLASDTVGIITSLEKGSAVLSSRAGNGISTYTEELIRQGDLDTIREIIARLQAGNGLTADPSEFLSRSSVDTHGNRDFQNASNLGYMVGSVREAITAIQTDAQEQAATLNTLFGAAFGLAGLAIPSGQIAGKAALVLARPLSAELVDDVTGSLADGNLSLGDAIEQLALPADIYSSDVTGPFGDAIDAVIRN